MLGLIQKMNCKEKRWRKMMNENGVISMDKEMDVKFFVEWRKKYGLTQVKAAELLEMSVSTYRKYEKGERVLYAKTLGKVSNKDEVFELLFWLEDDEDDALRPEEERLPFADETLSPPEEDINELPFSDSSVEPDEFFCEDDDEELPFPEVPEEKNGKKRKNPYQTRVPVSRRLCSFKIKSVRCRNGSMTQWFLPCIGDRCMSYQDGRCVRVK